MPLQPPVRDDDPTLRVLLDAVPVLVSFIDAGLVYRAVNGEYSRWFGRPRADIVGRPMEEVLGEDAMRVLAPRVAAALAGEQVQFVEKVAYAAGGERWIDATYTPHRGREGRVDGFIVLVRDITEQMEALEARAIAERELQRHFDHSPFAIVAWDGAYRVTRWSGLAERTFGWSAAEAIGRSMDELRLVPEEEAAVIADVMRRMEAGHPHVSSLNRNRTKDGRLIECEWHNSTVMDERGRLASVLSFVMEVTERQRTRRTLELLERAGQVLADAATGDAALEGLARLPLRGFADWTLLDRVGDHGDLRRQVAAHRDPARAPVLEQLCREFPIDWSSPSPVVDVLRDGEPILVPDVDEPLRQRIAVNDRLRAFVTRLAPRSLLIVPVRIEGRVVGAMTWVRSSGPPFDQADLALAEELATRATHAIERAALVDRVARANRTKDEFLATFGHELRQPLAALTTALALLRESQAGQTRALDIAERQTRHISRLVEDLLDLTRIERRLVELRQEPLDLRRVAELAADAHADLLLRRQIALRLSLPDHAVPVVGDPTRLHQVISNLLHNAAKFTPTGGSVDVVVDEAEAEAVLRVRDTGIGIPRDRLLEIFQPFTQTLASGSGGLGIGLAVVRHLCEAHGGTVAASSAGEGLGSEFIVRLPAAVQA